MVRLSVFALIGAALAGAPAAADPWIEEIRLGVVAHDLSENTEDGPQITLEALFKTPGFLEPLWAPEPFLYGSFNTQGFTNLGAVGLAWDRQFSQRWSGEFAFGFAYHDGVTDVNDRPPDDPIRIFNAENRALLGSNWLFRTAFGLDYDIGERWGVGIYYEHFSNGGILGDGDRNQGLDEAGARLRYRFGG